MRDRITEELRAFVNAYIDDDDGRVLGMDIADRIDAEHERRMERSRYETRRAVLHYLRGVLLDYEKGVKRVRKCDKEEVVRCRDCELAIGEDDGYVCVGFASRTVDGDDYCSYGERRDGDG